MIPAAALTLLAIQSTGLQATPDGIGSALAEAALKRTAQSVTYDPAYFRIPYPGGDVPADKGVCTDVVIRAYRVLGIDLQALVHEDMRRAFRKYPKLWSLRRPDPNIDHRRVPNLRVFLARHGVSLPVSEKAAGYRPGDLVTWNLVSKGSLPHIGIVAATKTGAGTPLIIHNIGQGPVQEDILFQYRITGHYRYGNSP